MPRSANINLLWQCRKNGLPLWQCPQFIFLLLGIIIIASLLATYFIAGRLIQDPLVVVMMVLTLSLVLMILDFLITRSFERLAEVSRMKSDFINIVSHQLRTPLSNFKWGVEALNHQLTRHAHMPEAIDNLDILEENLVRMTGLVSELLTVSRIEEGRQPAQPQKLLLSEIISQSLKEHQRFAKAQNIEFTCNLPPKELLVWADPIQARHIIDNLIENAVKYGQGHVRIDLRSALSFTQFKITDHGIGIDPEDQKYIFGKFFRGKNAIRAHTDGTGLGLYIVKTLAEKMGGQVGFSSSVKNGTSFWFTLPTALTSTKSQNPNHKSQIPNHK